MQSRRLTGFLAICLPLLCCTLAPAQRASRLASSVSLPYTVTDSAGNQWMIYQNAMLQERGNLPIFSQGAVLTIDGTPVQAINNISVNRAMKDAKTGELIFDGFNAAGVQITRRVLIRTDGGYVRYIDVFKNTQAQAQTIDIQLQTRMNFQILSSQEVSDPAHADQTLAWVAQTQGNRAAVVITAGRNARHPMTLTPQPDQNLVESDLSLTIPANKTLAVMSVYSTASAQGAGIQFVNGLKDNDLLKDCSLDVRREIVNFDTVDSLVGDREVLRGGTLDVIELRSGDSGDRASSSDELRGTLKEPSYTLHTFYGEITLPADRVIGMISVGQFRPRQLLVTADGQVFGGTLARSTIPIELSSGQVTDVPLADISRFGYRRRSGESDSGESAAPSASPMLLLRGGDRIAIDRPAGPIDFLSRYGPLKLPVDSVSAINFQSAENSVHTLYLTDGTHLAGLLQGQNLTVTLLGTRPGAKSETQPTTQPDGKSAAQSDEHPATTSAKQANPSTNGSVTTAPNTASAQTVTIPTAAIARLQLGAPAPDPDDRTPTLQLSNGDLMVGKITGQMKVDTAFDTLTVNGSEIHTLTHARDARNDVQIGLWDQTRISGSVQLVEIPIKLVSGPDIAAPVSLIDSYTQPQPQASPSMIRQIDDTVKDLAADDWKQRERAESGLVAMGPGIVTELKRLSPTQPPEAQDRIAAVIRKLSDKKKADGETGNK